MQISSKLQMWSWCSKNVLWYADNAALCSSGDRQIITKDSLVTKWDDKWNRNNFWIALQKIVETFSSFRCKPLRIPLLCLNFIVSHWKIFLKVSFFHFSLYVHTNSRYINHGEIWRKMHLHDYFFLNFEFSRQIWHRAKLASHNHARDFKYETFL